MERYLISKRSNTSYVDCGEITPLERGYIVDLIKDEIKKEQEKRQELEQKAKNKKR